MYRLVKLCERGGESNLAGLMVFLVGAIGSILTALGFGSQDRGRRKEQAMERSLSMCGVFHRRSSSSLAIIRLGLASRAADADPYSRGT